MATKNIQIRPKGVGDYADVLHPETNSAMVIDATSAATANMIIKRDASGRAKVTAPSASDDIARKAEVDTVQADLNSHKADNAAHNATSAATANSIILRDEFGRAKVAAPSEGDDIVRLDTLADYAKVFRGGKKIQSGTMSSSGSSSGSGYYRKDFSASFSAGFTNSSSIVICVTPKFKFGLGVTNDSKLLWGVRTVATNNFYFSIEVSAESYLDYISSNGLFYIAIGD